MQESGLWFCFGSPNQTNPHPTETAHESEKDTHFWVCILHLMSNT